MIDLKKAILHSGYQGKDAMRENAMRELGSQMKYFSKEYGERPGSFSAPSRTKMRLYKKGGHTKGTIPGGSLTNLHMPKPMGYGKSHSSELHVEKGHKMKKGGHHKHGGHYDRGGHYTEVYGHQKHFSRGGYAHGGDVYEREMMGEHSGRHPHFNYESQMRGEHCSSHAGTHRDDKMHHVHPSIKGLKMGGRSRFAAGGVAKVRHGQATMSGRQLSPGASRTTVY